jgi:hypothetical protein
LIKYKRKIVSEVKFDALAKVIFGISCHSQSGENQMIKVCYIFMPIQPKAIRNGNDRPGDFFYEFIKLPRKVISAAAHQVKTCRIQSIPLGYLQFALLYNNWKEGRL